jgi:hypothetical protein
MQLKFGPMEREAWNETLFPPDMKFSGQNETRYAARVHGAELCMHFLFNLPRIILSKRRRALHCARVEFVMVFSARQPKSRKGFIIYEIDLEFMRFKVSLSLSLSSAVACTVRAGRCRRGYINIDLSRTVKHNGREFIFNIKSRRPR